MTHEFSRAGRYRFGTGLHYMSASAGPFLGFMTDGRAQLSPLPVEYDALHFPGFDFSVPATKERFRTRLEERFPAPALIGQSHELAELPEERSAVMLFLGLDRSPAEFGLRGENHWFMPDLDEHDGVRRLPGEGTLYVSFASLNNPAARFHTVELLELVDPKVVDQWRGTPENERPDSYRKF
ncbi:hypothetical protein ABZ372_31110, partial [Streptomyces sp. NPDC005921]